MVFFLFCNFFCILNIWILCLNSVYDIIPSQDQKIGCTCQHLGGQDRIVQDQGHSGLLSNICANLYYIGALCLQQAEKQK